MERSRSNKRYHPSPSSSPPPRPSRPRYPSPHGRRSLDRRPPPTNRPSPSPSPQTPTTVYRILCPEAFLPSVIGKSSSLLKSLRHQTGASISVLPLHPSDRQCIIETSDTRPREPDGRPPRYSPAQDALLLLHERIVDAEVDCADADEDAYGSWERERGRITTRLVVPRMHVGCLMGKGGKIIEQMRIETKTHIRILPRDADSPRCVATTEEVVQVVGDANAVKKAVSIISSRLKESLHRDRGPFRGRVSSPDRLLPDEDFGSYGNNMQQFPDGVDLGSRSSGASLRGRNVPNSSRAPGYAFDYEANIMIEDTSPCENIIFRILCPNGKVERVVGESDGFLEMLHNEVGVEVIVDDPVPGSDECIITISSEEGPDDELFPAQEALLHIQNRIVDLDPNKDNIITTRLLIPVNEVGCLEGRDGPLSEIRKVTGTNIQILQKEESLLSDVESEKLIEIVGEIRMARSALVHLTSKLRDALYGECGPPCDYLPSSVSAMGQNSDLVEKDSRECSNGSNVHSAGSRPAIAAWQSKGAENVGNESSIQEENNPEFESKPKGSASSGIVTKKTLEVIIPEHAVHSLTGKSSNKLILISEMSGASVSFTEARPDSTQKVVQISGNPEQAERAQSLLQGFILSTLDDAPVS